GRRQPDLGGRAVHPAEARRPRDAGDRAGHRRRPDRPDRRGLPVPGRHLLRRRGVGTPRGPPRRGLGHRPAARRGRGATPLGGDGAREVLDWVEQGGRAESLLPEQALGGVQRQPYVETWTRRWGPVATPLTWSHAAYLILDHELAGSS